MLFRVIFRAATRCSRRTILSASFTLDKEWAERHSRIQHLKLGGDYEWIATVQKKFVGGGAASAVDVDAAACMAEQADQLADVIDLVYKTRHCRIASRLLPSSEYALIRLALRHNPDDVIRFADDPINYGIFLNEHSACLAIDYFIKKSDWANACRLSTWCMQQEEESRLVRLLSLFSVAKWAEQGRPDIVRKENDDGDDDEAVSIKLPYLKNPFVDNHLDVQDSSILTGRTLEWFSSSLSSASRASSSFLAAVLLSDFSLAASRSSASLAGSVVTVAKEIIAARMSEGGTNEIEQKILDTIGEGNGQKLSEMIRMQLEEEQEKLEQKVTDEQKKLFLQWDDTRKELIQKQTERLLCKIRLEEIDKEMQKIKYEKEKLFFFENRIRLERMAKENAQIAAEAR